MHNQLSNGHKIRALTVVAINVGGSFCGGQIILRGDLAAILVFAAHKKKPGAPLLEARLVRGLLSQDSLGAGTGFEPVTFRL